MPWQTGDIVGPTNLNLRGGSAASSTCFSSNTLRPESGNTVSFQTYNTALIAKSIDSGGAVYNVRAFGAAGDGVTDDTAAIRSAISAANFAGGSARSGSVVYFPAGSYVYTGTLQVPVTLSASITLKGAGMRSTYLFPSGLSSNFSLNSDNDRVCLVFGALTPDPAGTFTNQTQYCGMEDMSQSGSLLTDTNYVAHQITEMQFGYMRNCIIEAFPNNSIGLYLRGSTVTGGLGASSGPHVRLCNFINCLVSNIGSNNKGGTPVLLQNADENSFVNCSAGCTTGQTMASNDTIFAVWVQMGRNNRWYGCLEQGDTSSLKTAYVGWVLGPPQNRAGAANGQVHMNQMYGDVLEGFDRAVWFQSEPSGNLRNNTAFGINPSIINTTFLDSNPVGSNFGNMVYALATPPINYFDGPLPTASGAVTITGATPSVAGNNVFVCGNGALSLITSFTNTQPNQMFWVRLDSNTSIRDLNNGGGGDIVCWGRADIVGQTNMWVPFLRIGGNSQTQQLAPPIVLGNVAPTNAFKVPVPMGAPDGSAAAPSYAFTSELSQGFYRSVNSVIAFPYGQLAAPAGANNLPSFTFGSNRSTGFFDNAGPGLDVAVAGGIAGRALTSQWAVVSGSAARPGLAWTSETSLGWSRSANSTMQQSYGTMDFNQSYIASVKTATSINSTVLGANAWAVANPAVSGASLCININGVMYIFNSSATTIGR